MLLICYLDCDSSDGYHNKYIADSIQTYFSNRSNRAFLNAGGTSSRAAGNQTDDKSFQPDHSCSLNQNTVTRRSSYQDVNFSSMTTDWNSTGNVELGNPGHPSTLRENGSGRRLSRGDSNGSMEIRRASPDLGSGENILLEDLSAPLQDTTVSANKKSPDPKPMLRYRKRSAWLLAIYVPLLVLPWALTCLMAVRPLNLPS